MQAIQKYANSSKSKRIKILNEDCGVLYKQILNCCLATSRLLLCRMIVTSKYNIKILASNNSFESMQVKGDQKFSSLKQKPQGIAAGH